MPLSTVVECRGVSERGNEESMQRGEMEWRSDLQEKSV